MVKIIALATLQNQHGMFMSSKRTRMLSENVGTYA